MCDLKFCSPFVAVDQKLIGGVTLNHLSWAALGGGEKVEIYIYF